MSDDTPIKRKSPSRGSAGLVYLRGADLALLKRLQERAEKAAGADISKASIVRAALRALERHGAS
jgi:hypothetical protein